MINSDSCKEDCLEQLLHELCYCFSIMIRLWDSPAIPTPHQHHIVFNNTYSDSPHPLLLRKGNVPTTEARPIKGS